MKLTISNIGFDTLNVEVKAHNAQRTIRLYEKRGWELVRRWDADGRTALEFRQQSVPPIEVQP